MRIPYVKECPPARFTTVSASFICKTFHYRNFLNLTYCSRSVKCGTLSKATAVPAVHDEPEDTHRVRAFQHIDRSHVRVVTGAPKAKALLVDQRGDIARIEQRCVAEWVLQVKKHVLENASGTVQWKVG